MNNTLSKVEKENPCRRVPSPDGVVAYHAALSRLRPGFKSRSGRHSITPIIVDDIAELGLVLFCISFPPIPLKLGLWWDFLFLLGF